MSSSLHQNRSKGSTAASDETNLTDIEIHPDGRIFVFGMSAEVLQILDTLQSGSDGSVRQRLLQQAKHLPPSGSSGQLDQP